MVVATVLLAKTQTSTLFICSLKLSVDTEKLRFQEAALNTWLLNLEFLFWLEHFSVFGLRLQSVVQKSFGLSQLATVNYNLLFKFWDWFLFLVHFKKKKNSLQCLVHSLALTYPHYGMAIFGWCSTEKPTSFTWPFHVWDSSHPVGYSKCVRVPFLFPLCPHMLFSPPAHMRETFRGTSCSYCVMFHV